MEEVKYSCNCHGGPFTKSVSHQEVDIRGKRMLRCMWCRAQAVPLDENGQPMEEINDEDLPKVMNL